MAEDKIILGENCVFDADTEKTGLNNNVIVFGGSGSGKTMSIAEPRLLYTHNTSMIVTVTKRSLVKKYRPLFEKRGYKVFDMNFTNPQQSDIGYNPLNFVKSYRDITYLAESIINANPRREHSNADPFWDEAAISLLSCEIAYTIMMNPKATLSDVLKMHDELNFEDDGGQIKTSYDAKFRALEQKDPSCFAVTCFKTFKKLPIKTASCVFSTLNTILDTLFSPEIRKIMAMKKTVNFKQLSSEKTLLFITTSPVNPTLNCFVNIFYGHVFKQLFEYAEEQPDGTLPIPVHIMCDDFATGSKIFNFEEYISVFRAKAISVTLLLQSESQLESMYGYNQAVSIINNCDTYCYMGGMDMKTVHNISLRIDQPFSQVMSMPLNRVIIFKRGQKPIVTNRYDIREDKLYQAVNAEYQKSFSPER